MANLLSDAAAMEVLFQHIRAKEGDLPYFYVDRKGLITIAIGILVDRRGVGLQLRRNVAQAFANRWHANFTTNGHVVATAAQVLADWDQVAALYTGPGAPPYPTKPACAALCDFQIRSAGVRRSIWEEKIRGYVTNLTNRRPFMSRHNARIQMAFVDTLYNPGIPIFISTGDLGNMWNALDPDHAAYDPKKARDLFERIWRAVESGTLSYQQRVDWRLARFDEGLVELRAGYACVVKRNSRARSAKVVLHPGPPSASGIIGVFSTQADADAERGLERSWSKSWGWECWVRRPTLASQAYVNSGNIVAVYDTADRARRENPTAGDPQVFYRRPPAT